MEEDGTVSANVTKVAQAEFELKQNYPNPFDYSTSIPYALAAEAPVKLRIYNSLGQTVRTLVDDYREEGVHEASWDGRDEGSIG